MGIFVFLVKSKESYVKKKKNFSVKQNLKVQNVKDSKGPDRILKGPGTDGWSSESHCLRLGW